MKRYIYGFFVLLTAMLAAWVLTGCADDVEPFMTEDAGTDCIKLVVSVPMDDATDTADDGSRATDPSHPTTDELSNNEFMVKSLHFYFYQGTNPGADTKSVYDCVWDKEEFNTQKTVTVSLPSNALLPGGIFPGNNDTECTVYTVANVDNKTTLPEGTAKTINELKTTALNSAFAETKVQDSFAMDGEATVTVDRSERKATGEITLYRAAAKITLAINVGEIEVTPAEGGDPVIYTPNCNAMHVWISNGVKNSMLNTDPAPVTVADDLYSNKIEAVDNNGSKFTNIEAMEKYKYVQNVPFYSYPNKWVATSPDGNCFLTLVVPWSYNGGQITTYYRIPVNPDACTIERNMHYDIRVTIGRLGSTEPQKPIDMTVDWNYAIPWNTQSLVTDIKQIRYLLLNQNYYDSSIKNPDGSTGAYAFEMNNTTDIDIPIGTSHETIIESVTLSWYDLLNNTSRKIELTPSSNNETIYKYSDLAGYTDETAQTIYAGIEVDNTASRLKLNRKMLHIGYIQYEEVPARWEEYQQESKKFIPVPATTNTNSWKEDDNHRYVDRHYEWKGGSSPEITDNAAINSYTFDIVLCHADDKNRTAKVRITQYPDIYITAQMGDAATRFVNNNYGEWDQTGKGVQFVPEFDDGKGGSVSSHYAFSNGKELTYAYTNTQRPETTRSTYYIFWDYYMGTINVGANKNTYLINVSKFNNSVTNSEEKVYIIGDPRVRVVDNLPRRDSGEAAQATATWSKEDVIGKQLSNYYPTDGTSGRRRFMAPKFRVASQLGITHPIIFDAAKRRCASYQENGRPAGRWRLPTVAEIEYIATLSSKGFIPYLFGSSDSKPSSYFCGEGFVKVDNRMDNPKVEILDNTDDMIEGYIRCVYDEWYWDTDTLVESQKATFTWGDRPRDISGN